ncbi:type II toxin-antitoxin system mRNA interferase toxin, RelE/StbE family [Candidatus Gottesmanbacteria bacterium]|nr:type II toxin-antitoxin system mRNA interferase toxin, RelE/StbE family [Candidatus Gottesmanbacteria bacterium]
MQIKFGDKFEKQHKKVDAKRKTAFAKRLEIFLQNPYDPLLNNHSLTGNYSGFRSINVTGDWRAVYFEENGMATFVALGTHSQLYK